MFNFPIFLSCILFARLPKHSQKFKLRLFGTVMHLSVFSPRGGGGGGGAGDTLRIRQPKQSLPPGI